MEQTTRLQMAINSNEKAIWLFPKDNIYKADSKTVPSDKIGISSSSSCRLPWLADSPGESTITSLALVPVAHIHLPSDAFSVHDSAKCNGDIAKALHHDHVLSPNEATYNLLRSAHYQVGLVNL